MGYEPKPMCRSVPHRRYKVEWGFLAQLVKLCLPMAAMDPHPDTSNIQAAIFYLDCHKPHRTKAISQNCHEASATGTYLHRCVKTTPR